jgi:SHS2 domain-containing protein
MSAAYATFAHEAVIGVRGTGQSLAEALEGAALALTAVVVRPERVRPARRLAVRLHEADPELLLYAWLSEIIRLMDTERMVFSRASVRLDGAGSGSTLGRAHGPRAPRARGGGESCDLRAAGRAPRADGSWTAQAVVDV